MAEDFVKLLKVGPHQADSAATLEMMDNNRRSAADAEAAENQEALQGLIILALIGAVSYWCCGACVPCCCFKCCRRRKPADIQQEQAAAKITEVTVDGVQKSVEHLIHRKELPTAYFLWCGAGLWGAHHFYLDRLVHGVLAITSFNFLGLGWCLDAFLLPTYVNKSNARVAPVARYDGSCRRICCWLPLVAILWSACLTGGFFLAPRTIHNIGLVDIDTAVAGTESNPYTQLGLAPDCDHPSANAGFQRETQRIAGECKVNQKKCKERQKELKKAYEYVTKKWKPRTSKKATRKEKHNSEIEDWVDSFSLEWKALGKLVETWCKRHWDYWTQKEKEDDEKESKTEL